MMERRDKMSPKPVHNSHVSSITGRGSGRTRTKSGLRHILLTVAITSTVWVILDMYLIHFAGISSSNSRQPVQVRKMPVDLAAEFAYDAGENEQLFDGVNPFKLDKILQEEEEARRREKGGKHTGELHADELNQIADRKVGDQAVNLKFIKAVEKMKNRENPILHNNENNINDTIAKEKIQNTNNNQNENANMQIIDPNHVDEKPVSKKKAILANAINNAGDTVLENHQDVHDMDTKNADKNVASNSKHLEGIDKSNDIREKIRDMDVTSRPRDPNAPGENGRPVKTNPEEEAAVQREWVKAEFNLYVSDKISLERSVPDARHKLCREKMYPYSLLPRTSIIICFTDEAWSTLLRSVHSVLNRSPPELLEEIILVDDFSQAEHLQKPLENYIAAMPKVKLLRLPSRHGLIRARLAGVVAAKAPVITFLDSHIECNVGWLEPLMHRIYENRTNVVSPIIDSIDSHSMRYTSSTDRMRGGFTWVALQFRWKAVPADVESTRKDPTSPLPSPTMAGGLFSIDKSFFFELGTYDPGLEIWGAENIELSLKTWMCGGRLEILPCSHVAHIFRTKQPYKFPSGDNVKTFIRNSLRVVNVWMDDYKDVFYAVNPSMTSLEYGDVTDRLRLKEQLHCKSFDWYVKNIYKDLELPPAKSIATGALMNTKWHWCLDRGAGGPSRKEIGVLPCHGMGGNQDFRLTDEGIMAVQEYCITTSFPKASGPLSEAICSSPRIIYWEHTKGGLLKNKQTGLCLGVAEDKKLAMMPCFMHGPHLYWTFSNYKSDSKQAR